MEGLVASGVVVRFGGLVALDGVNVEATRGRITGLIGPNGAGKTTMFNVICGFQAAEQGTVELDGVDISKESPARRARLGVGRTFQRMELFGSLSVRTVENHLQRAYEKLGIAGRGELRAAFGDLDAQPTACPR